MTDSNGRAAGLQGLIEEHKGVMESVIAASGLTKDTIEGVFRRSGGPTFSERCKIARYGGAAAPSSLIQALPNDHSEPPAAWQSYRPRPGWEPPVTAGKGKAGAAETVVSIVTADWHVPYHHKRDAECAKGIIREVKPHRLHLDGDIGEYEAVSKHPKSRPDLARLAEEYYAINVELDSIQHAAGSAEVYMEEGNHESRVSRFCAELGSLDQMLDVPASLYITPRGDYHRETSLLRGIHWIPLSMQPFTIGELAVLHGVFESKHHAQATAEALAPRHGAQVTITAHMHGHQGAESAAGFRAYACPWMGDETAACFRAYVKGKPRPWSRGLLIIEESGRLVTVTHVPIVNGRALHGGVVVGAA